ncbi:MAG TPA: glutamine--fructose-6-phosphate transaminase (isomerizing), partial [Spongiibacteraceae bacterium]|nr:glutamine--fructose-6-phosphate transaminase (isomerizing) [Spongiibacteraceae bacterium]
QDVVIERTLLPALKGDLVNEAVLGADAEETLKDIEHIHIVACGTSYHAGLVASYTLESLCGISCKVELASEYRYRRAVVNPNTLFVTLSQSGETADTLAALRFAKRAPYRATLTICNVDESSLVRESDLVFLTQAGPEIGVASTKAFTTQLMNLNLLAILLARYSTNGLSERREASLVTVLKRAPEQVRSVYALDSQIRAVAESIVNSPYVLFLGRGQMYPIAMEGALKFKEITYINADAYAAGELKHGPLALVDDQVPVVALAPYNPLLGKLKSNLAEVRARGGRLIVIGDQGAGFSASRTEMAIDVPKSGGLIAPMVYTLPLQLLAYHVAVLRGTNVDQPRNLAKSVTVE